MKNSLTDEELLKQAASCENLIYIYGPPSMGKTYITRQVIENDPNYIYVYINCNNVATPSKLHIEIANALAEFLGPKRAKELGKLPDKVLNISDLEIIIDRFCQLMKMGKHVSNREGQYHKIFIVLDQIDLFKGTSMIDAFIALDSMRASFRYELGIILISCEDSCDFASYFKSHMNEMRFHDDIQIIRIDSWGKEKIVKAILQQSPTKYEELYAKFVHNVVSIVHDSNTRDFREIRSFCQENFERFIYESKKRIHDSLKQKNPSIQDIEDLEDEVEFSEDKITSAFMNSLVTSFKPILDKEEMRNWGQKDTDRKVVINTSILIVAVYVAAYTKPTDDTRNFVKHKKRQTKKLRTDPCEQDLKPFTLERLLHIYDSLSRLSKGTANCQVRRATDFPDSILSDVQLLEDLDIIHLASGDGLDSHSRYKLSENVSKRYVEILAKQTNTPLTDIFGL